jgi:DNA-binding CsgD family transcriptional regulator
MESALDAETRKVFNLSRREIQCLTWAAQGKTYSEIGMMLGLSFGTVKTHLDTARYKLGGVNLTHAVALAITFGKIFMTDSAINHREKIAQAYYGEFGVMPQE